MYYVLYICDGVEFRRFAYRFWWDGLMPQRKGNIVDFGCLCARVVLHFVDFLAGSEVLDISRRGKGTVGWREGWI